MTQSPCAHSRRRIINSHTWTTKKIQTYRFKCLTCGYRWTTYRDLTTNTEVPRPTKYTRLTPDQIHYIFTDPTSTQQKAKKLGVSPQAISQVLLGLTHKHDHPNIPRHTSSHKQNDHNAVECRSHCHWWWSGTCELSIPEAGSPGFASECSYFKKQ